jgi:hypothetical protein
VNIFNQFRSTNCLKLWHSSVYSALVLQQQTGIVHGSYITPFTSVNQQQAMHVVVQQPPAPSAQQQEQTSSLQQQTQKLYIATNYQQSGVPPVILQQSTNQQVIVIAHMYLNSCGNVVPAGRKHNLKMLQFYGG